MYVKFMDAVNVSVFSLPMSFHDPLRFVQLLKRIDSVKGYPCSLLHLDMVGKRYDVES